MHYLIKWSLKAEGWREREIYCSSLTVSGAIESSFKVICQHTGKSNIEFLEVDGTEFIIWHGDECIGYVNVSNEPSYVEN